MADSATARTRSLAAFRKRQGLSGKAAAAGVGAATGSGSGAAFGALACVAAGPFFPLCLAAVVPTATAIGAVSGAAVGAGRSESADAMESKRAMLQRELAATSFEAVLVGHLRHQAREAFALELPVQGGMADA